MFSLPAMRELSVAASSIEGSTLNAARVGQKTMFLIDLKPSPVVLLEGARDRCHRSGMLTSEDHRQLAERCIRLAKTCTKPPVAEQLVTLAANYLELAERALRLRQPASFVRQQIKVVRKE
jgi:hypothetical protein